MRKKQSYIIISIVLFTLSLCYLFQINYYKKELTIIQKQVLKPSQTDLKIILGDAEVYNLINLKYVSGDIPIRDYLLYSFIMAGKYGNAFAAQQFADVLINYSDLPMDSTLSNFLLDYLKMAAEDNDSMNTIAKATAAFQLSTWYERGNNYLTPNDSLSRYYDSIGKNLL